MRIIAMLMIVSSHFSVHGGFDFPLNSITVNRLWQQFLALGQYGNGLFILVSGYFLVESPGLKPKKLLSLWSRMFFYSFSIFCLFMALGLADFDIKLFARSVAPLTRTHWWFASTYFVMYLIHPYLNILLRSFSREDYKKFLTAIFIYWSIIPTFLLTSFEGSNLMNFICLYSLAGYFRLWAKDFGSKKFIIYGVGFMALNFLSFLCLDVIGRRFPFVGVRALHLRPLMRPFTILAVVCLFLGFRRLTLNSKLVNILASATFGVYLIHEHKLMRPFLWLKVFKNFTYQNSPYLIPYSLGVIIFVYVACTLIELARMKIFRLVSRGRLS